VLPPVGQRNLAASDEVRFVLAARHVLERGVGFGIKIRQTYFREKPPLYSWMIAGLSWPTGRVTPTTAQIPVGIAAVVAVVATFLLGERLFDRPLGLGAALILATTYGFFSHSQYLLPDMLVMAFMALASYAFWVAMHDPPARGGLVGFYVAMALAVYAKGPMGLMPLLVGLVWIAMVHGPRAIPGRLWSPTGLALFGVITLSWLGPFLALGSSSFATDVLAKDWLRRYLGPPAFRKLALDTVVVLLPWTIVAPMVLTAAFRARGTPAVRFALLSCVVPWLLLLPMEDLRTRYMLPVAPGLALLVAWWLRHEARRPTPMGRIMGWVGLMATAAIIVLIVRPTWFGPHGVYFVSWSPAAAAPLVLGLAVVGVSLWWGLNRGAPACLRYGVVAGMALLLAYGIWPYNASFNRRQDYPRLAALVGRHAQGADIGTFGGRWFAVDYYLGRSLHMLTTFDELDTYTARVDRPLLVLNGRTWNVVKHRLPEQFAVLGQMPLAGQEMFVVRRQPAP